MTNGPFCFNCVLVPICVIGLEGRGVGGDGSHCNNSKLDELNVSGGVGSNSNGINGANNPNRKKKKKRRHRFDYVFQHQKNKRQSQNEPNGLDSIRTHPSGAIFEFCTTTADNKQTKNLAGIPHLFLFIIPNFISILSIRQLISPLRSATKA
jgi:hypothetical protein